MPESELIDRPAADDVAVAAHVARVAAFLESEGRTDAAASLLEMLREPAASTPSMHIAGEATSGKSCLVNALLRVADLSPTGARATTSAPITFHHASAPCAAVFRYGRADSEDVDVERARSLVTLEGNPANEQGVRAASIGLDRPLLAHLDLVDTPGVGGLDSGHGALTIQSLNDAEALIFVLEADSQIRPSELQFLDAASARIETVIFAMTKVDLYPGWRTTLELDRAVLHQQVPRLAACPIVPVSSTLAIQALTVEDHAEADALRAKSGLTELERVIDECVLTRVSALGRANLLRATLSLLSGAERDLSRRLAALASDAGHDALLTEQARLQELGGQRAEWQQVVDAGIRQITLQRQEQAGLRTLQVRHRYEQRLKTITKKEFDALPSELMADLTALASELNEMAREQLLRLIHTTLVGLEQIGTFEAEIDQLTSQPLPSEVTSSALDADDIKRSERRGMFSVFAGGRALPLLMSGSSLGVALGVGLAGLAPPLGLALGFTVGSFFAFEAFMNRNRQVFSTEFTTWMRDQLTELQLTLNTSFNLAMIDLEAQLRQAIQVTLAGRQQEIGEAISAARAIAAAGESDRQKATAEVAERRAVAQQLRSEAETLLDSVRQSPTGAVQS